MINHKPSKMSYRILLLIVTMMALQSCRNKEKTKKIEMKKEVSYSCCDVPPPTPPVPFELFQMEEMKLNYYGEQVDFEVAFFSDRLYDFRGGYLQTYSVIAKNNYKKSRVDSFYFALPSELNKYWEDLVIEKAKPEFRLGYYEDEQFIPLYTICMGDELNKGSIYMEYFITQKK